MDSREIGSDGDDDHGSCEAQELEDDVSDCTRSEHSESIYRHGSKGVKSALSLGDSGADVGLFLGAVVFLEDGPLGGDDAACGHDC